MDRKRATGPDSAHPLVFGRAPVAPRAPQAPEQAPEQAPPPKPAQTIRNFFVQTGVVDNANGSCYLEVDGTAIIVSVYGAKPVRGSSIGAASFTVSSKLSPNVGELANFKSRRFQQQQQQQRSASPQEAELELAGDDGADGDDGYLTTTSFARAQHSQLEQKLSTYIQQAFVPLVLLHKYPKAAIECFVNVLTNDQASNGDLLSLITWAANCTALALVDSGLELKDIVTTGSAQLAGSSEGRAGKVVVDPLYGDGSGGASGGVEDSARAVVSYMSTTDSIVGLLVDSQAELSGPVVSQLVDGCNAMAREIRANINGYLVNSLGG